MRSANARRSRKSADREARSAGGRRRRARTGARADRDRDRQREREEHAKAGALDTVVVFDAKGSVSVSCPVAVIVTGAEKNEIRVPRPHRKRRHSLHQQRHARHARADEVAGAADGHFDDDCLWARRSSPRGLERIGECEGRAHGDVEAPRTRGGDIRFAMRVHGSTSALSRRCDRHRCEGETRITTVSGGIGSPVRAWRHGVESVSGDVDVATPLAKQVRMHTTSATCPTPVRSSTADATSSHTLARSSSLPTNRRSVGSVSTFNGGIESDFPITLVPGRAWHQCLGAKRLNFSVGSGTQADLRRDVQRRHHPQASAVTMRKIHQESAMRQLSFCLGAALLAPAAVSAQGDRPSATPSR